MIKPTWETLIKACPLLTLHVPGVDGAIKRGVNPLAITEALIHVAEQLYKKNPNAFLVRKIWNNFIKEPGHLQFMTEQMVGFYWAFNEYGAQVYKMAREFSEQLRKTKLDLSATHLPATNKIICIEFPENMRFHLGPSTIDKSPRFARSVFIHTTDAEVTTQYGETAVFSIEMQFQLYDVEDNLTPELQFSCIPFLSRDESFELALERMEQRSSYHFFDRDVLQFVLNCLIYINSGEPDLREYRKPSPPLSKKAKVQRRFLKDSENLSMIDMVLVGYGFLKGRTYHVGETSVTGHFRWQPYGPRRELVKLIWIDEHTRTFKQGENSENL